MGKFSKESEHAQASYSVERLEELQPDIRAQDWRSPLVLRLLQSEAYKDGSKEFKTNYRGKTTEEKSSIWLHWANLKEDFSRCIKTYQEPVLTEYATLGLACILIYEYPKLRITEVTRRGEKADYWLGEQECLLEVSGQANGKLENLRETKAQQLLANPFKKPGFVCVANYSNVNSYVWYYSIGDNENESE